MYTKLVHCFSYYPTLTVTGNCLKYGIDDITEPGVTYIEPGVYTGKIEWLTAYMIPCMMMCNRMASGKGVKVLCSIIKCTMS